MKSQGFKAYLSRLFENSYIAVYLFFLFFTLNLEFTTTRALEHQDRSIWLMSNLPTFWGILICALLSLIRSKKAFKLVSSITLFFLTLLWLMEHCLVELNSSLFDGGTVVLFLATSQQEMSEFFENYTDLSLYTESLTHLLLALSLLFISKLLIAKLKGLMDQRGRETLYRISILVLFIPMFVIATTRLTDYYIALTSGGERAPTRLTTIDRAVISTVMTLDVSEKIEQSLKQQNGKLGQGITKSKLPAHKLILIIGETTRADYMHCYGYPLENTPRLDSLVRSGALSLCSDVLSSDVFTIRAVPNMLSAKAVDEAGMWYEQPLLPIVLQQAGYKDRTWLNGQVSTGVGGIFHPLSSS